MQSLVSLNAYTQIHTTEIERGIVVAVVRKGTDRELIDEYLDEIEQLCITAGAKIVLRVVQERVRLDPARFIGKGKTAELVQLIKEYDAHFVVFDDNLSPAQERNLQQALGVKVLDRTMLILDIFAKHARTIEAKTQVELAQLQYLYPRLTRLWTHLSRQYGGIGTKGPGETQIETDRRMIKERIAHLKRRLAEIEQQRALQRKERRDVFRFALIGYTNAGKSTLFNLITYANSVVENKLFATLDTTVRRFSLPSGIEALLSDTVGFIRRLPAHLVASFRSTLSEAVESDVLIHVADATHPALDRHIQTVAETLAALGIDNKPSILVLNKIDTLTERHTQRHTLRSLRERYPTALFISAQTGYNVHSLLRHMELFLRDRSVRIRAHIPYNAMKELSYIYANTIIEERHESSEGITIVCLVPHILQHSVTATLKPFIASVELTGTTP